MSGSRSEGSADVQGPWGQQSEADLEAAAAEIEAEKEPANENTIPGEARPPAGASDAEIEFFIKRVWDMAVKATMDQSQVTFDTYNKFLGQQHRCLLRLLKAFRMMRAIAGIAAVTAIIEFLILVIR
jgi:hypothetical protein